MYSLPTLLPQACPSGQTLSPRSHVDGRDLGSADPVFAAGAVGGPVRLDRARCYHADGGEIGFVGHNLTFRYPEGL